MSLRKRSVLTVIHKCTCSTVGAHDAVRVVLDALVIDRDHIVWELGVSFVMAAPFRRPGIRNVAEDMVLPVHVDQRSDIDQGQEAETDESGAEFHRIWLVFCSK